MDNEKLADKINEYIESEKDNIVSTLKTYINYKSINKEQLLEGQKTEIVECQKWLKKQMEDMNCFDNIDYYELEEKRPNVVGVKKGKGGGRSLLFNAHSDVVTVSEEQKKAWKVLSAFDGGIKDGKVWGRGATDMKGGGTAMLYAFKALKELRINLKGDLILSYVDGEESGRAEIGIWSLIDRGYTADFAIMGEPTNLNIFNKSKGEIYLDIKVEGESTHICNRYRTIWPQKTEEQRVGVNAIDKMVKLINAFSELERSWGLEYYDPDLEPGSTTVTVSMIRGGESFSAQAGECTMTIASMFAPQLSVEEIKGQLMGTIECTSKYDYWLKDHPPRVSLPFPAKVPLDVPRDDESIRTCEQSFQEVMKQKPTVRPSPFVGDVNYMFEKGIKGVNWGPGDLSMGIHGPNEHVPVDQVLNAAKIYAVTALNWCGLTE
ncbi:MAG: M20 family metallopeptidase [Spirochaetota bacterium]